MTGTEFLKTLGDIDERFLTEEYRPAENKKSARVKGVKFAFAAAAVFALITVCAVFLYPAAPKTAPKPPLKEEQTNVADDVIVFGTAAAEPATNGDIDGRPEKADLVSRFDFLNSVRLPEEYVVIDQWILYEKENPRDTAYSKPWQYEVLYAVPREIGEPGEITESVEITFTKEELLIDCMLPDKSTFPVSSINGREVYLQKSENTAAMRAFFESGGYKFYVSSAGLSEAAFVELVRSVMG